MKGKKPATEELPIQLLESMRRSIDELRESEQKYRNIFTNSPLGIYYYTPDGYLTECNEKFLEILGSNREKVIGLYILSVVKDPMMLAAIKESLAGRIGLFEGEYLSMSSGKLVDIKATYGPMFSEKGALIGGIGIIEDISERMRIEKELREARSSLEIRVRERTEDLRRANESLQEANERLRKEVQERSLAEDSLRESRKLLRSLLDNSTTVIYVKDREGRYILINKTFERLFNVKEGWLIGKTDYDLFPGETADAVRANDIKVIGRRAPVEFDEVVPHGNELHTYISVKVPIFSSAGEVEAVCGISTDITERKRSAEEKEKLQAQLLHSQKMEAVGVLAGGVAHDFNNIITVVKSLTDLMIEKVGTKDRLYKYLQPISESSKRAANLVQQLLLFSSSRPKEISVFDLNEAASELLGLLEHLISEDVSVETDLEYKLWRISADRGRIEQVITNLVVNSSEAMRHGGTVTVSTKNVLLNEKQCRGIQGATPGRYVCLSVEDEGEGIDKEVLKHIFEPFFTTKKGKNSGMGLSVVYGIVKDHDGWINVSSKPNAGGAVFSVCLPATEEESTVPEQRVRPKVSNTGAGKKILLVEDEKWVRKSTAMVLSENGYEVFEAANAEAAVGLFYRKKGKFDLIFSDVVMPGRSGLELAGLLADLNPRVPVLLCSSYLDDKAQLSEIIKRGLSFIQKPYEIQELLEAIEDTITQSKNTRP